MGKAETSESKKLDPLRYPWDPPTSSGLIHGGRFLPLQLAFGRRLGQSHQRDGGHESFSTSCSLNKALVEANAAPLDTRYLVVSVGSNSSPEVMHRKFADFQEPVSRVLPLVRGELLNIDVGHSAHVSKAGYIAAAPYFRAGVRTTVWVAWLDAHQLRALIKTEPNYQRIQLNGEACPLILDNGERPKVFSLFTSRWGVLTDGRGEKIPFKDQPALFRLLAESVTTNDLEKGRAVFDGPPEGVLKTLQMPLTQVWVKEWFREAGLATPVQFDGLRSTKTPKYGSVESIDPPQRKGAFRALPMDEAIERQGQQCIGIHPDDALALGIADNAIATALVEGSSGLSSRPGVMVRVVQKPQLVRGAAFVDQVIRNALGIERQEYILLKPATAARVSRALSLVGDPSYIVCRVQSADLASVEQEVALLEPLAMRFLGILHGDAIIVEGVQLDTTGVLQPVRLRSIELGDSIGDRRRALSGGGFESRFPSSSDALGVFPDLPSVFLDAAIRHRLGLGNANLTAVRIRASTRHQLLTQLREVLLVLVLALVGLISILPTGAGLTSAIVLICLIAILVVIFRLRGQLGLRRSRSRIWYQRGFRRRFH